MLETLGASKSYSGTLEALEALEALTCVCSEAAFRCNPRFVRKVALAADTSVDDLNSLASEELDCQNVLSPSAFFSACCATLVPARTWSSSSLS